MKSIRLITATAFVACLFLGSTVTFGQTTTHELGLRFFGLDDFDFVYKKGTKENRFTRFRLANFNFQFDQGDRTDNSFVTVGLAVGWENRKAIKEKLYFVHGFEPRLSMTLLNDQSSEDALVLNPGIGYILGFQYDVSDNFYVNLEVVPSLSFLYRTDYDEFHDFRVWGNFNTDGIALSLVYRFTTTKED